MCRGCYHSHPGAAVLRKACLPSRPLSDVRELGFWETSRCSQNWKEVPSVLQLSGHLLSFWKSGISLCVKRRVSCDQPPVKTLGTEALMSSPGRCLLLEDQAHPRERLLEATAGVLWALPPCLPLHWLGCVSCGHVSQLGLRWHAG